MTPPATIDDYLATVPATPRATLEQVRSTVRSLVPDAVESISYGMPTFKYRGRPLIYFAAGKKYCAIYGTRAGTMHFPHDQPLTPAYLKEVLDTQVARIDAGSGRKFREPKSSQPP